MVLSLKCLLQLSYSMHVPIPGRTPHLLCSWHAGSAHCLWLYCLYGQNMCLIFFPLTLESQIAQFGKHNFIFLLYPCAIAGVPLESVSQFTHNCLHVSRCAQEKSSFRSTVLQISSLISPSPTVCGHLKVWKPLGMQSRALRGGVSEGTLRKLLNLECIISESCPRKQAKLGRNIWKESMHYIFPFMYIRT